MFNLQPHAVLDQAEAYLASQASHGKNSLLDASGAVLYSDVTTLKSGPVYFLGLNPGGSPESTPDGTLGHSLAASRSGLNAFLDQSWRDPPKTLRPGEAPLQRRIQMLFVMMGLEVRSVAASNLVFTRSRNLRLHENFTLAIAQCRPVHELFVQAIHPRIILTHGSRNAFRRGINADFFNFYEAHHAAWKIHSGVCTIAGRRIPVINMPHLSFWAIDADTLQGEQRRTILKTLFKKHGFSQDPR
ncbi:MULTISPECIES: hypothetical protein [unclassified Asaia]|uniref:hypothetical protein n=1 Tax=unclassified Asaia TaxID=2685023 RepID=UPI000F8D6097|nr:hypothetical protein [Asaia sp. W19]